MRHTAYDLAQMQSLPLEAKVSMTIRRIRDWYEGWDGDVYLSFSGGKDSTVLKHIVDSLNYDIPSVFVNTGLEYPEAQKFAMSQKNVEMIRPKLGFADVIKNYGYPVISKEVSKDLYFARRNPNCMHYQHLFGIGKYEGSRFSSKRWSFLYDAPFIVSDRCCHVMKKSPVHIYERQTQRKPMIAMLAEESEIRKQSWMRTGCNSFETSRPRSMPMAFWTEQDVLHYIKKYDIPYCSIYGDIRVKQKNELDGQVNLIDQIPYEEGDVLETTGCERTGCMFCMFGCHHDKEPNRFQRMKKTHPKQWNYCINGGEWVDGLWMPSKDGLGMWYVLDFIGVKYE